MEVGRVRFGFICSFEIPLHDNNAPPRGHLFALEFLTTFRMPVLLRILGARRAIAPDLRPATKLKIRARVVRGNQ